MSDLATLINTMRADGTIDTIARNRRAQFGRTGRRYLGATLLPERTVEQNMFREEAIRYRTVIANDGTRYSPTQLKSGDLIGSFSVELGNSDIARQFDSQMYDALLRYLQSNQTMEAVASVTNWLDTTVNLALVELEEKQRWEAIVDASVVRLGDNEYSETVSYSNPAGHRAAQTAAWSTDSTDIFEDIFTMADLLASKGYTVSRMITSRPVLSKMANNNTVKTRTGVAVVNTSGQIQSASGRATLNNINAVLESDGLPPIETYDLQYRTQSGTGYFLKRDVFVLVATTNQDETLDFGDTEELFPDTLGYLAIGRAAGQSAPGRVIRAEAKEDKPPRIEAEGWQSSLVVIQHPEAIAVVHSIT
jgi:hypothetical protein